MYGGKTKRISKKLNGYTGPYPYQMLNDARYTLMKAIEMKDTVIWSRIRSKTGIFENRLREAGFKGWGESSTYFSHADLLEENVTEGSYQPRRPMLTQATSTASATTTTADVDSDSSNEEESISSDAVGRLKEENTPEDTKSTSTTESETLTYVKKSGNSDLKTQEEQSKVKIKQSRTESVNNLLINDASNTPINNNKNSVKELEEGEIIDIDDDSASTIEISDDTEIEITVQNMTDSDPVILIEDNDAHNDINGNSRSKFVKGHILPNVIGETKCRTSGVHDDVIVIDSPERKDVSPTDYKIHQSEASVVHLDNSGVNKVRDKGSQIELHSGNDNKTSGKNRNPCLSAVFKCDFCASVCDSHSSMTEHLKIANHFSASKVNRNRQTGEYKLLDKLVIMNKDNLFKGTVTVCPHPTCREICQTIYTCALHHRLKHDSVGKLTYGLADVLQTTEFINPCLTMTCPVCHDSFNKQKASIEGLRNKLITWNKLLVNHFKEKNHYPFDHMKGECYFICADCHDIFKDLYRVLIHQDIHQVLPRLHDMKVIVIYIGEVRICELPETYHYTDNLSASSEDMVDKNSNTLASAATKQTEAPNTSLTIDNGRFVIDRKPIPVARFSDKHAPDNSLSVSQSNNTATTDKVNDRNSQYGIGENGTNKMQQKEIQNPNLQAEVLASDDHHSHESRYMFLCDYCNTLDQDRHVIYQHLVHECHSSASTVLVDKDNNPATLLKPKSIMNYRALYKKVVAACPIDGCLGIFGDVYVCSAHCKIFHKCNENICGFREIVQVVNEHHPANFVCRYCKNEFESRKLLNRHMRMENHIPDVCRKEDPSTYLKFLCLYCEKMNDSLEQLISHIESKHFTRAINDYYKIQILLISKDVKKKWILPFSRDEDGEARNIDMNLVSMRTLKGGKSRHVKRKIQQQIEKLCLLKAKRQKQI